MLVFENREKYDVDDLVRLVKLLRSEDGCPWDREQTHDSIKRNFIEEAYETAEAIDEGDVLHLREELGDVLTNIIFHADIEDDAGNFNLGDVADATVRKLLYRHPHVFGDTVADTADDVIGTWDELKRREKSHETTADTLRGVARSLPALWRAEKVYKKAVSAGCFDCAPAADKLLAAVSEAVDARRVPGSEEAGKRIIGDLLALVTQLALSFGVDPEDALNAATDRFIGDVERVENSI